MKCEVLKLMHSSNLFLFWKNFLLKLTTLRTLIHESIYSKKQLDILCKNVSFINAEKNRKKIRLM